MDTTYWERSFWVMLFKDVLTKENLLKYYVKNAIDGHFADLKNKLRIHNGLFKARKKKFIDEVFKGIKFSKNLRESIVGTPLR